MQGIGAGSVARPERSEGPTLESRIAGLADLQIGGLRNAWSVTWGAPPPKGARRRLLMLGIAWKWQAGTQGGLSRQLERRLASLEAGFRHNDAVDVAAGKRAVTPRLLPGARLIRVWKEERHEVHVTETGFLWRGGSFASLSAIAREITGNRRNGPACFGLRDGSAT